MRNSLWVILAIKDRRHKFFFMEIEEVNFAQEEPTTTADQDEDRRGEEQATVSLDSLFLQWLRHNED